MTAPAGPTVPGSTRIHGNALAFKLGDNDVDYWMDFQKVALTNDDSDNGTTTFYDAAHGGSRLWYFDVTVVQSTETTSAWRWMWDKVGQEVAFTYAPHGNATATADQPHFIGTCKVKHRPVLGGEAQVEGDYTADAQIDIIGTPTLDDGSSSGGGSS
jgi:hypothetical protein